MNDDGNGTDLHDPAVLAGVVVSLEAEVKRQGRLLDRVARFLGVEPEKSDPPVPLRARLDSFTETDALTSQQIAELTEEQAKARLEIQRVDKEVKKSQSIVQALGGLRKAIVKVAAAIAIASATAGGLLGFGREIWAAIHGH